MIEFNCIDISLPYDCNSLFQQWISYVVSNEGKSIDSINYIFTTDSNLLEMNQSFLNHDYYTDIITFDYSDGDSVSGDLFISYERIIDHATEYSVDVQEEFLRVCVHGVLHLLGYKDKEDIDIQVMRSKELFYIHDYVSRETLSN